MIRLYDIVRLIRCQDWTGRVEAIESGQALVMRRGKVVCEWMPLEFLELRPGQEEEMTA